jgi:hypothetical protein
MHLTKATRRQLGSTPSGKEASSTAAHVEVSPPVEGLGRRQVLKAGGFAGLGIAFPRELIEHMIAARPDEGSWRVFTAHEAAVVEEATARLIPGPSDEPSEKGHPGAREAKVTRYIDTMLGALDFSPAKIFAGGPFSDRAGGGVDDMAKFLGLPPGVAYGWKRRLESWHKQYRDGVAGLDRAAGGSFLRASNAERDKVLARDEGGFVSLMFGHAIEGMYSVPEYGGNHDLVGWKDIGFPGDVQPRGYTASEVSRSDGRDRYVPEGAGKKLLALIRISNGR